MEENKNLETKKPSLFKRIGYWISIMFAGAFMSISDVIPGFSGGIALTLSGRIKEVWGTYKKIVKPILKGDRLKGILFYCVFALGSVGGIFGCAQVIKLALIHIPSITNWFFLTLAVCAVFIYWKLNHVSFKGGKTPEVKEYKKPTLIRILFTILGMLVIVAITIVAWRVGIPDPANFKKDPHAVVHFNGDFVLMCVAGFLASAAMVTPGMSGALVITAFGVYPEIYGKLFANPGANIWPLLIYSGCTVIGTVFSIVVMDKLYSKFKRPMTFIFLGTVIASVGAMIFIFTYQHAIIPPEPIWWIYISIAVVLAIVLVIGMYKLIKYEEKKHHKNLI